MARIKYIGSSDPRVIGKYEWNSENEFIQTVTDPELIENLKTYPYDNWKFLGDDEQLPADRPITDINGIGEARAEELNVHDIKCVGDLAALDKAGIEHLASHTGASRGQAIEWVRQAQKITSEVNND